MASPIPADDLERSQSLRGLRFFDSSHEEALHRAVRLAREYFRAPIALVSLAGDGRQSLACSQGWPLPEHSGELSFCDQVVLSSDALIVLDASGDPRFLGNPAVAGPPRIRFVAGVPLFAGSRRAGAFCILDTAPRDAFPADEAARLGDFAALLSREIELMGIFSRLAAAEEDASRSDAEYRGIFLNSPYGIYRTTVDGLVLMANPAFLAMLGIESADQITGRNLEAEGLIRDRARFREQLLRDGAVDCFETVWLARDGHEVPVRECARAVRSASGQILYLEGTVEDVSARRYAEFESREARSLVEKIILTIPALLYVIEIPSHRCLYINAQIFEFLGYSPSDLERSNDVLLSFAHPDDVERLRAHHAAFTGLGDGESREIEYRARHRNGEWKWLRSRETIFSRDSHGRPTQILGAAMEFTGVRKMEERLQRQEERWQLAIAANNDGLFDWDLHTNQVFRSVRCLEILGRPGMPESIDGDGWFDFMHPEDRASVDQCLAQYLSRQAHACAPEFRILHPNGDQRWLHLRAIAQWDEQGRPIRLVGSLSDITSRKRTEIALRLQAQWLADARDKAEAATRAKSAFLATMSHEIRTPINAVVGMTGLLLDTLLSRHQQEYVETIRSSGETLLALIEDILDFSKIEAGRLELVLADFDLPSLAEEALELVAGQAQAKDLELIASLDPALPAHVLGDAGRIRQVLLNLLGNAVKFTSAGEVVLRARARPDPSGRVILRFEVADTGIGVAPEAQGRLFDAFTQADSSTTRRYGGTGLGLAISKQLVELMGGVIGIESAPGVGSCFWFEVPVTATPVTSETPGLDLTGRTALVVEDHPTALRVLSTRLETLGCAVAGATSPEAALSILTSAPLPDFAILDFELPGMDGRELSYEIHNLPRAESLPVIIATNRDNHRLLAETLPPGVYAILSKPIRRVALRDAVRRALRIGSASVSRSPVARTSPAGPRILLAEDNPTNQRVAVLMLERLGYSIDLAATGKAAVEAWRRGSYPLILMDCQMPELDGVEATREIRRLEGPGRRTIIIALTANAQFEDRQRCEAAGMDDYLVKPVRTELLKSKLEHWIAHASL